MATSQSYLNFILEQLSGLDNIAYQKMMGEYIIYYNGKIAAYLCDDRMLVKILPSTAAMLPDAPHEPPQKICCWWRRWTTAASWKGCFMQ